MQPAFSTETQTLDVEEIRHHLGTQILGVGDRLLYFPSLASTNALAMQLAQERPAEGMVILTDSQTAGKGRQGRRWVDTPGCSVLSSTLLQPRFPPHFLVMIASLAVVDAIAQTSGLFATIKWPNDILVGERKVAGILIETRRHPTAQLLAVVGIGMNVNGTISSVPVGSSLVTSHTPTSEAQTQEQVPFMAMATTLAMECGRNLSRESFIVHLLAAIESSYLALQQEADNPLAGVYGSPPISRSIRQRWRNHLSTLGRNIVVRQGSTDLSGIAEDVNDSGELLLRRHSGEFITITWGDVGYPHH